MIKQTINSKDIYLNLTKLELARIEIKLKYSLQDVPNRMDEFKNNPAEMLRIFDTIFSTAYGERTEEGRFVKSEVASNEFLASNEYSDLIEQFIEEPDYAEKIMNGMIEHIGNDGTKKRKVKTKQKSVK